MWHSDHKFVSCYPFQCSYRYFIHRMYDRTHIHSIIFTFCLLVGAARQQPEEISPNFSYSRHRFQLLQGIPRHSSSVMDSLKWISLKMTPDHNNESSTDREFSIFCKILCRDKKKWLKKDYKDYQIENMLGCTPGTNAAFRVVEVPYFIFTSHLKWYSYIIQFKSY